MVELTQSLISENYFRLTYREFSKGISQYLHLALYLVFFMQGHCLSILSCVIGANMIFILVDPGHFRNPIFYQALCPLASCHVVSGRKETAQYSFSTMQFNIFLGRSCLPSIGCLLFGPANLQQRIIATGIGAFVVLYLLRQFRGLLIGVRLASLYKFQFFFYLCAIEIGPILLIYRQNLAAIIFLIRSNWSYVGKC